MRSLSQALFLSSSAAEWLGPTIMKTIASFSEIVKQMSGSIRTPIRHALKG
jgi:hypothetical protein